VTLISSVALETGVMHAALQNVSSPRKNCRIQAATGGNLKQYAALQLSAHIPIKSIFCHFVIIIVKYNENWLLVFKNSARKCFWAHRSNG
jgi:hypothetical protein